MNDRKPGDSPSGFDREQPSGIRPYAERLHREAASWDPAVVSVSGCLDAFARRLKRLIVKQAEHGSTALADMDPKDIAQQIRGAAAAAQLTGMSGSFELIGALALAGMMSAARAEELRVDLGGDEAA